MQNKHDSKIFRLQAYRCEVIAGLVLLTVFSKPGIVNGTGILWDLLSLNWDWDIFPCKLQPSGILVLNEVHGLGLRKSAN